MLPTQGEATNTNIMIFGLNQQSTALEVSMPTITPMKRGKISEPLCDATKIFLILNSFWIIITYL